MSMTLTEKREARNALTTQAESRAEALERVLIGGDLSRLSAEQRVQYVQELCARTGLDALTQPFEYLNLQGKLVLYAKKACTDQLRAIHEISVVDMDQEEREGVYSVTVKVQNGKGRTDMDIGSVKIAGLAGDARANAMMKASTKAKRRATLSICGLGMLDELELETIPQAARPASSPAEAQPNAGGESPRLPPAPYADRESSASLKRNGAWDSFMDKLQHFKDARDFEGLKAWYASEDVQVRIARWPDVWREQADDEYGRVHDELEKA